MSENIAAATIAVKVVPRAASNEIVGWQGGSLKVRVTAVPEAGRANAAVEALIAEALGIGRSAVRVVSGHTAARKRLAIQGLDRAEVERRLASSGRPERPPA